MSLIHDSLRKLESNQSKDSGLVATNEKFETKKGFNAKQLWILIVVVFGVALIIYAYLMLSRYQKQNQILLEDMKQFKTSSLSTELKVEPILAQPKLSLELNENLKTEPIIVQAPIQISDSEDSQSYASLVARIKKQDQELLASKELQNKNADFLLTNTKPKIKTMPTSVVSKKKAVKKKINNKLTIKQTRQLVNNLQIQINNKNSNEVDNLLSKLALSSGDNSIVYLRMNAYWSSKIEDVNTAAFMYKKILFQKPNDIQATTNLALLEAKSGQIEQAVNRLKVLRIQYPSDKNIVAYLERIEVMHEK